MSWEPDRVRRAVLLIETEAGVQHGYEVTGNPTMTVSWDPPDFYWSDMRPLSSVRRDHPATGTVTIEGTLTGLVRMPGWIDEERAAKPDEIIPPKPELGGGS